MSDTIFGKIVRGETDSEFLYEDEHCVAINDLYPQAPVHILVIPKKGVPRLVDAETGDKDMLGHLMLVAGEVARQQGVGDAFRLVVNNGADAGQTVFHLHLHILGGLKASEGNLAG